ncbi:hypothetical protein HDU78_007931 [Chytriomyces hyalinus]|nr:hypothetical protein HDU78_007931 [Chytriomyces hyalinus]
MTRGVPPRSAFDLKAVVNLDYIDEYREIGKLRRAKDKYSVEMKKHLESLQGHAVSYPSPSAYPQNYNPETPNTNPRILSTLNQEKGSGRNKRDKDPETIAARKAALKETQERQNIRTRTPQLNPNLAGEEKIDGIAKDGLKRATLGRADLEEKEKEPKTTTITRKTESAAEYVPPFVKAALDAVKMEKKLKEKAALEAKNAEKALQEKEAKPAPTPNESV